MSKNKETNPHQSGNITVSALISKPNTHDLRHFEQQSHISQSQVDSAKCNENLI